MNTSKFSAKITQRITRFDVAPAMSVQSGHMGYQIEAVGISDSKSSLDFEEK